MARMDWRADETGTGSSALVIATGAFTVFALGLRHGADPDHLAAIDNLTRNCAPRRSRWTRFIGTIFAGGHTIMIIAIAALIGFLGSTFAPHSAAIERIGTWVSILMLLFIATLNFRQLASGRTYRAGGFKTGLLPVWLRQASSPWMAIPVGLLFGFGFETSSQIAAYAVAFGADAGILGAVLVGVMFSAGMCCTDTLDSILVHRLVTYRSGQLPHVMRVWIWSVSLFAVAVAVYELVLVLGVRTPFSDLAVSGTLVLTLLAVFAWIFAATRTVAPSAE